MTPALYPVKLRVVCPRHGEVDAATVTTLRAQQQWEGFHRESHGQLCVEALNTLVADDQ